MSQFKVQLGTLKVKSWSSGSCNEIWILPPFSKAAMKTHSCFALDTEQWYWNVTVQSLCRVKKISMTRNVLPLHFARPGQAKIQMFTSSSWINTILLKSLGVYHKFCRVVNDVVFLLMLMPGHYTYTNSIIDRPPLYVHIGKPLLFC